MLYWMIAFRRTSWNFSLDRAVEWAVELGRPLVIFEPLRIGYRWASDRIHAFVTDGMADNAARIASLKNHGVLYYPYVEPAPDHDKGLLEAIAEHACVIVTDDYPAFFLPRMVSSVSKRLTVKLEKVDSNGLLPLRATDKVFTTAYSFRAFLQKQLPAHLGLAPKPDPLKGVKLPEIKSLPGDIVPVAACIGDVARYIAKHTPGIADRPHRRDGQLPRGLDRCLGTPGALPRPLYRRLS